MRLYLSYRRTDVAQVTRIATALEVQGQDIWWDRLLLPGTAFEAQFFDNMQRADVFVAFISKNSTSGIQQPQEVALAQSTGKRMLVVKLDDVTVQDMPHLAAYQWLDASRESDPEVVAGMIVRIARAGIAASQPAPSANVDAGVVSDLATHARDEAEPAPAGNDSRRAVFIVHGHDEAMMVDVADFLRSEAVEPIVLKKLKTRDDTLFEKFKAVGGEARFAVVLLSADDLGASLLDYNEDGAADRALMYRARQNVILELGFFFGKLGWDNVFVLKKEPPKRVPKFERPSDLDGVLFESYDQTGEWKEFLRTQLKARRLI